MKIKWLGLLLLSLMSATIMAQQKKSFTLNDLMPGGNTWHQHRPATIYTTWWGNVCVETQQDACYTRNAKTGKATLLFTLVQLNSWTQHETERRVTANSCYNLTFPYADKPWVRIVNPKEQLLVDFKAGKTVWKQTLDPERSAMDWNPQSRNLAFCKGNNLYVTTADGKTLALSQDGSNDLVYGQSVFRDEFGIHKGTFWSPDGTKLAFYRMDQSMVPDYPQVDIDTRIATTFHCKYPMAGEKSHVVTIGVFDTKTQKTTWMHTDDPDMYYLTNLTWAPDNKNFYLFELSRNQKNMLLGQYNTENGKRTQVLYREKHPKYIEPMKGLYFLPWDNSQFLFFSQRDGYNHLYLVDTQVASDKPESTAAAGGTYQSFKAIRQLTQGNWVTLDVLGFNAQDKSVIIRSNEAHPLQANAYSVKIANGKRRLLGQGEGVHHPKLSADGTFMLDKFSTPTRPNVIDLVDTHSGKSCNLIDAPNPWAAFNVPEISSGSIKAADDSTDLFYRMVKPVDFDPNKKYPTVVYVYGGPHAHNVEASWNYLCRGWEIYMAQKGYLLFILDNRGSENRGLNFENVTHRHLGVEEMKDQMRGVEFLKSLPYVDADRIGVHGWSFGGFMTTNLMLTYPNTFKVGVAGGPVIDWQYYEVMYGERYMETPQANPEGYAGSNLRLKAKNLEGKLQLIIGYNDPVCVPQHSLSFLRAAIDAGKQVDFFAYPGGEHNMFGSDQVHLHERITQYFEQHLK